MKKFIIIVAILLVVTSGGAYYVSAASNSSTTGLGRADYVKALTQLLDQFKTLLAKLTGEENSCVKEGDFYYKTSSGVSGSCCSNLTGLSVDVGNGGEKFICYNPAKAAPVCLGGKALYYSNGTLLRYMDCALDQTVYVPPVISTATDTINVSFANGKTKLTEVTVLAGQSNCQPLATSTNVGVCHIGDYDQGSSCFVNFQKSSGTGQCVMKFVYLKGLVDNTRLVAKHYEAIVNNGVKGIMELQEQTNDCVLPTLACPAGQEWVKDGALPNTCPKYVCKPKTDNTVSSISISSPSKNSVYQKGQSATIQWVATGLAKTPKVQLLFYGDGFNVPMQDGLNPVAVPNTGSYTMSIPDYSFIPTGTGFRLRITTDDGNYSTTSEPFTVNPAGLNTPSLYVEPSISNDFSTGKIKLSFDQGKSKITEVASLGGSENCQTVVLNSTNCSVGDQVQGSSCTVLIPQPVTGKTCIRKFVYLLGSLEKGRLVARHYESKMVNNVWMIRELEEQSNRSCPVYYPHCLTGQQLIPGSLKEDGCYTMPLCQ